MIWYLKKLPYLCVRFKILKIETTMKKFFAILAIAGAMTACNNSANQTETKTDSAATKAVDTATATVKATVDSAAKKIDSTAKAAVDTIKAKVDSVKSTKK